MEQSPSWETNWFSASQEIPVHTTTFHFLKIQLNIILPSMPGSPKRSLFLRFPYQNPVYASPTCPTHLIILDFITQTILGKAYRSLSSSLCSFLYYPITLSLWGQNILLSTLFSNTLNLRCALNVSDQVSHPYKTTGKILVLYFLIFKFLNSKLEDKIFCTIR